MNAPLYDSLPDAVTEVFTAEATAERAYDLLTVDVPAGFWIAALEIARDKLGCTYFDWLSAVDEPGTGFRVCAHVVSLERGTVSRLLLRTTVPHEAPVLASAVDIYAGASWHERETYEMFGVTFTGHPHLVPLLLPEGFEGHPLRKDFVLAARVAKAWPGAKEPGESEHGGPKRRQMLPPGVPDPNEWGPLKGQLPPAPTRPARTPRATTDRPPARTRAAQEAEPARRARTAAERSASQQAAQAATDPTAPAAGGSGSQQAASETPATEPGAPARRARTAAEGSASQPAGAGSDAGGVAAPTDLGAAPAGTPARTAAAAPANRPAGGAAAPRPARSSDAPWHNPRPAFDPVDDSGEPGAEPGADGDDVQKDSRAGNRPGDDRDAAGGDE
ncbi:NADH-quinone oxidoreductase subunit C [Streptomyces sp. A3M-1-3]|uniref:NADH-quinone oxidoreductase subunit C n=1 Tax=Streptomyces sp. A3M-1-3 TaxID=2962044 RepID=UPI0020B8341C|nr:NADH-quinone oxidoreductase subunit C [Streptomyces sp. A3M-1-3]MCP3819813.1 NADH-quinone oxidoreductase subunit C [Streptomyces sp. A3M-1-3]